MLKKCAIRLFTVSPDAGIQLDYAKIIRSKYWDVRLQLKLRYLYAFMLMQYAPNPRKKKIN